MENQHPRIEGFDSSGSRIQEEGLPEAEGVNALVSYQDAMANKRTEGQMNRFTRSSGLIKGRNVGGKARYHIGLSILA